MADARRIFVQWMPRDAENNFLAQCQKYLKDVPTGLSPKYNFKERELEDETKVVYAYCQAHTSCKANLMFIFTSVEHAGAKYNIQAAGVPQESEIVLVYQKNHAAEQVHATEDSTANRKYHIKQILDQFSHMTWAQLTAHLDAKGIPNHSRPSFTQFQERRKHNTAKERFQEGAGTAVGSLRNAVIERKYDPDLAPHTMFVVEGQVVSQRLVSIPFTCMYFLQMAMAFLAQCPRVHLVVDGTYKLCRKRYVLMGVCAVGHHFVKGAWRMSALPLCFLITQSESEASYTALFTALLHAIANICEIDNFTAMIKAIYSDRHPGAAKAIRKMFPDAAHRICLQHIKKCP